MVFRHFWMMFGYNIKELNFCFNCMLDYFRKRLTNFLRVKKDVTSKLIRNSIMYGILSEDIKFFNLFKFEKL